MSKEEPEAKDGLGEDIEDGVGNDLSIDVDIARPISNTPDAVKYQLRSRIEYRHTRKRTLGRRSKG